MVPFSDKTQKIGGINAFPFARARNLCCGVAALAASVSYAADIAVFNFDNVANPVENLGIGGDGELLGGATVAGGELVIAGEDQALDIPIGAFDTFNGLSDWRVEFDFERKAT